MRRTFYLWPLIGMLGLSGCASTAKNTNFGCAQAPERVATPYTPSKALPAQYEPLPASLAAVTRSYRLQVATPQIMPCTSLKLHKEIFLQRRPDPALVLKEVREFYAQDGTLIARHSEDVSRQLQQSGAYSASVSLPIPAAAPSGTYRIVSKLLLQRPGENQPTVVGWTHARFRITNQP